MSQLTRSENSSISPQLADRTVFVTGFGPFRNYTVNSSWEAVKRLNISNAKLVIKEIPVVYDEVDNVVEDIWTRHKPWLVVHCGVSSQAKCLILESRAFGSQYNSIDICGRIPKCEKNAEVNDACKCIISQINLSDVCDKINSGFQRKLIAMPIVVSHDAGRYLCEYIYYSSLTRDSQKTVFIHVPEIDNPYSLEQIADSLQFAIQTLIDEFHNNERVNTITDM